MKPIVTYIIIFATMFLFIIAGTQPVGADTALITDKVSHVSEYTTVVETPLLDSLGLSALDQVTLTQKAKEISEQYENTTHVEKEALNVAGSYLEDSMEKITTAEGKPFEGGTTIAFTISQDNLVSGTVVFKFIEQGWTIKVNGIVSGFLTPDTGKLVLHSNDAFIKYAGKQYPITMNINAQFNGVGFDGSKELSVAGTTGTLGFYANPS